jgi:hypothetical protein
MYFVLMISQVTGVYALELIDFYDRRSRTPFFLYTCQYERMATATVVGLHVQTRFGTGVIQAGARLVDGIYSIRMDHTGGMLYCPLVDFEFVREPPKGAQSSKSGKKKGDVAPKSKSSSSWFW